MFETVLNRPLHEIKKTIGQYYNVNYVLIISVYIVQLSETFLLGFPQFITRAVLYNVLQFWLCKNANPLNCFNLETKQY